MISFSQNMRFVPGMIYGLQQSGLQGSLQIENRSDLQKEKLDRIQLFERPAVLITTVLIMISGFWMYRRISTLHVQEATIADFVISSTIAVCGGIGLALALLAEYSGITIAAAAVTLLIGMVLSLSYFRKQHATFFPLRWPIVTEERNKALTLLVGLPFIIWLFGLISGLTLLVFSWLTVGKRQNRKGVIIALLWAIVTGGLCYLFLVKLWNVGLPTPLIPFLR